MPLPVPYMGTKRELAATVAEVLDGCPEGPVLDVFSGMCSVATAVGMSRQVWCNDVQVFASGVAAALFTSCWSPPKLTVVGDELLSLYNSNLKSLGKRFADPLRRESQLYAAPTAGRVRAFETGLPHVRDSHELERERRRLSGAPSTFPYRLFSITFAGSYFSLSQCIAIDSARYAIDCLFRRGELAHEQRQWLLLALCHAVSKIGTTTGHFAQALTVKAHTLDRHMDQRRRSVWTEWAIAIAESEPEGTTRWRRHNRAYRADAHELLTRLSLTDAAPAVVYADPPYTADQYSRYYHVYETLMLYDYPLSTGIGRYRQGRFVSPFSLASRVTPAIDRLAELVANLGSSLVLSYPASGLLSDSRRQIPRMLRQHFDHVEVAASTQHEHSSLGASSGSQKSTVKELLYLAH